MAPKKKGKKTKAELEAEKLQREEEELKDRALEAKRAAEDAERHRQEELKLQIQRNAEREVELARLRDEFVRFSNDILLGLEQMRLESLDEVSS
jgi:serine phosphatase RsbU (regulator of sigma subunit)